MRLQRREARGREGGGGAGGKRHWLFFFIRRQSSCRGEAELTVCQDLSSHTVHSETGRDTVPGYLVVGVGSSLQQLSCRGVNCVLQLWGRQQGLQRDE